MISDQSLEIISDVLANFHDWEVENLRESFLNNLKDNQIELSSTQILALYEAFMSIQPEIRYSKQFSHQKFISDFLNSH